MNQRGSATPLPFVLGLGLGIAAGRVGYPAAALTRLTIMGGRQPLWRTPHDIGLIAEEVSFVSGDGVLLRGWFLPRAADDGAPAPAVLFLHGWPWNRLGNLAGTSIIPDRTVSLLEPAAALHQAGFHVLLFDLRNHGESGAALPVTYGPYEARDMAGAVAYLRGRPEVDGQRLGVIGYSMGANALIYGVPACQPIRAAVAVQPVRVSTFAAGFSRELLGGLGPALFAALPPIYRLLGAPPPQSVDPAAVAHLLSDTAVLYIQGDRDPWGSLADVQAMAAATPRALPLVAAPAADRFGGYLYVNAHLPEIVRFFTEQLGGSG